MKAFNLNLLTPDKTLFKGEVVRLNITLSDGGMEVLAGHLPSIVAVVPGKCSLTLPDKTERIFASSDGVLNITRDSVTLMCELLEWEEDVLKALKERERLVSQEHRRRIQSDKEYRLGLVSLQQAFSYLMDTKTNKYQ
jgi:F-type H+-transporting ATPase subunit epsilon